jgi:hypothetical protein
MAKKNLYKSKTNFTLRRLHQSGDYGSIYERDYTTVHKFPSNDGDQISVYAGPSFKLTVRGGLNRQKYYKYGNWLTNENSCTGSTNAWTLGCLPAPNVVDSHIVLKPNSRKLTDFACYGSAYELIRASLTDIVANFPAEIYTTNVKLSENSFFETNPALKKTDLYHEDYRNLFITKNPFSIDIIQQVMPEDSMVSPLRYLCKSEYEYVLLNEKGEVVIDAQDLKTWNENNPTANAHKHFWSVVNFNQTKSCLIDGDILAVATFTGIDDKAALTIVCAYYQGSVLYLADKKNYRIRPNNKSVSNFFNGLDDFEKVLLNQQTDYTAIFETYEENKNGGWTMREKYYKWPIDNDWNLSIQGRAYNDYMYELSQLAIGYDALFTNAIWRDMVHESISNMDLTLVSNGEENNLETSKVKQMLNIVGRQFDEIKKYADNIKKSNHITYSQDGDTPDYFLSDNLELSGWEPKNILNNIDNNIITDPIYGSRTMGYSASDANNEFMRRLQLNSKPILAKKGTKQCIEDLMAIFGYHSTDWLRKYYNTLQDKHLRKAYIAIEYVYVADGYAFDESADNVYQQVKILNSLKDNAPFNLESRDYNPYQGLPVAEVFYDGKTRLVPWIDKDVQYDGNMYFQMKGGWGRNDGNTTTDKPVYDYTITKIHYVPTMQHLYDLMYYTLDKFGVYYVGSTQEYYRLKDASKHDSIEGWEHPNDDEIAQIEYIIDNNKGNNPHTGTYDNGEEYLLVFGNLFKNSTFNNTRDDSTTLKFDYGFNIQRQADSTKCLYFSDDIEVDEGGDFVDSALLRGENRINPYNFFGGNNFDDAASLSVINSKELHIVFDDAHRSFLEKDVLPYLKQIIPSTTIFSYSFEHLDGDDNKLFSARSHQIICDGGLCPIYSVTE